MEMISPQSGENTVMQVSMGEGKSSVIIPITAATLADGHQLVRVVVPKALTVQMLYLLADRLGGLTNKQIHHLRFSRSDDSDGSKIKYLRQTMSQCMEERGILLVQPEDVLSLKLTSAQTQLPEYKLAVRPSSELRKWIHGYDAAALPLKFVSMMINTFTVLKLADYQITVERQLSR